MRSDVELSEPRGWGAETGRVGAPIPLEAQDATRKSDLLPVRDRRVIVSPSTLLPRCGQDHERRPEGHATEPDPLFNSAGTLAGRTSGAFASPERALFIDMNDFDETLLGPYEYDVKRLAASVDAGRNNGFPGGCGAAALASVRDFPGPSLGSPKCARWMSGTRASRKRT